MFEKFSISLVLTAFFFTSIGPVPDSDAQTILDLPAPGTMIPISSPFKPIQFKGLQIFPQNPLQFNFLIDRGESDLSGEELKSEVRRLTKYFLTCLTVPEDDLWVNLSPYEKNRIAPELFGTTQMGKDLLEQDYLLKQIVASITYPERELGKHFWQKIYTEAYSRYGTTDIPVNTFNKVWIVPKSAQVYVHGNSAFVVKAQLDVMLETDYLALRNNLNNAVLGLNRVRNQDEAQYSQLYSQIMKEVILPALRKEVNEGKNFAKVRQVYNAMILATWYKRHLKDSLFSKMYIGQGKINGVDVKDKNIKEEIFKQYLIAYKKRVYNYIREDYDPLTEKIVPRLYVSGGMDFSHFTNMKFGNRGYGYQEEAMVVPSPKSFGKNLAMASVNLAMTDSNGKSVDLPFWRPRSWSMPRISSSFIFKTGVLVALAVAGTAVIPGHAAQAATYRQIENGLEVTLTSKDIKGVSGAFEQLRVAWKKQDPQGYAQSEFAGKFYPALQKALHREVNDNLKDLRYVKKVIIKAPYSKEVLKTLPQTFSNAAAPAPPPSPPPASPPPPPQAAPAVPAPPPPPPSQTPAAVLSTGAGQVVTTATHFLEDGFLYQSLSAILLSISLAAAGLRMRGHSFTFFRKSKTVKQPVWGVIQPAESLSTDPDSLSRSDTELPAAAAFGEEQVLAQSLADLQAHLASRDTAIPPSAIPAEREIRITGSKRVLWMDVMALMAAGGLDYFSGGGFSLFLLIKTLFLTRAIYTILKLLHEPKHLLAASIFYPFKSRGETWTGPNVAGHNNIYQLLYPVIPLVGRVSPSVSYLAFTRVEFEDGFWNKFRNWLVGASGFFLSSAIVGGLGYFLLSTIFFIPLAVGGSAVVLGSLSHGDMGSKDTRKGLFLCGVVVMQMLVPIKGILLKKISPALRIFRRVTKLQAKRGNQSSGVSMYIWNGIESFERYVVKVLNVKRELAWVNGSWQLYRNMIDKMNDKFLKILPEYLVPIDNHTGSAYGVMTIKEHGRLATQGDLKKRAAHPHVSAEEDAEEWSFDNVLKVFRKFFRVSQADSGFNGDTLGIMLWGRLMGFFDMRRFFSAVTNHYYEGMVTLEYLKKTVSKSTKDDQENIIKTNYAKVLRKLFEFGYIDRRGYVNQRFNGLDPEFKRLFKGYAPKIFEEIESALFDMAPGDAPINSRALYFFSSSKGNWSRAIAYAHAMVNLRNSLKPEKNVLFADQRRVLGLFYNSVFEDVLPYLSRPGYQSTDPDTIKDLNDLYVEDAGTAQHLGLQDQLTMLEIFKEELIKRMKEEIQAGSDAGKIFEQWDEQSWEMINETALRAFFTADGVNGLKKFAKIVRGTHGIALKIPYNDGVAAYQNNQDIVIAFNQEKKLLIAASSAHVLGIEDAHGLKIFKYMVPLRNGEVAHAKFLPSGKISVRSWMQVNGQWRETTNELEARIKPTDLYPDRKPISKQELAGGLWEGLIKAEVVEKISDTQVLVYPNLEQNKPLVEEIAEDKFDLLWPLLKESLGRRNMGYSPPPVEYENERTALVEELHQLPKILSDSLGQMDDPLELNPRTMENFSDRAAELFQKNGHVTLHVFGYGNSYTIAKALKGLAGRVMDNKKFVINAIDAPEFNLDQSKVRFEKDDMVLFISKSGSTGETNQAYGYVRELIANQRLDQENLFLLTGRKDSLMIPMLGPQLKPRVFVLGQFFDSEVPIASDILLELNSQQIILNLAVSLGRRSNPRQYGLRFSPRRLEYMVSVIKRETIRKVEEITGYSVSGRPYANKDKKLDVLAAYMSRISTIAFWTRRYYEAFIFSSGIFSILNAGTFIFGGFWGVYLGLNAFWLLAVVPFLLKERLAKVMGRPVHANPGPFKLFIAAPDVVADTGEDFFTRLYANRLLNISPSQTFGGNPNTNFLNKNMRRMDPGDVVLWLPQQTAEGELAVNMTTFPKPGRFGESFAGEIQLKKYDVNVPHIGTVKIEDLKVYKGKGSILDTDKPDGLWKLVSDDEVLLKPSANIDMVQIQDVAREDFFRVRRLIIKAYLENQLMDETIGVIAGMTALKVIGVRMAMKSSWNGKLYKLIASWTGASVDTTLLKEPNFQMTHMTELGPLDHDDLMVAGDDDAMAAALPSANKGGIDMNSRLMNLKVKEDPDSRLKFNDQNMISLRIDRVAPDRIDIVPVTPLMLKNMLGINLN